MQILFNHNQKETVLLECGESKYMESVYDNYAVQIPEFGEIASQVILFDIDQLGFSKEDQIRLCDFMDAHKESKDVHTLLNTIAAMTEEDDYVDEITAQLKQLLSQTK